jgi:hypothetical protein
VRGGMHLYLQLSTQAVNDTSEVWMGGTVLALRVHGVLQVAPFDPSLPFFAAATYGSSMCTCLTAGCYDALQRKHPLPTQMITNTSCIGSCCRLCICTVL